MNLRALLVITLAAVAILIVSKLFWDMGSKDGKPAAGDAGPRTGGRDSSAAVVESYDEGIAPSPLGAKYVEIKPITLEDFNHQALDISALGYREIRVFANLFADEYKTKPLPKEAVLKIGFGHTLKGMETGYAETIFKRDVLSCLEGFVSEKIYGKNLKLHVDADNLPKGKYTLHLSYYLLP